MMKRDVHISPEMLVGFLQLRRDELAPYAVVSGQPQRVEMALKKLKDPMRNFSAFGYTFWTGDHKGMKVTVGNGGMYSPDTAISTEIICNLGVDVIVRLGSCGAMAEDIGIGDIVVVEDVIRGDGVTRYYVDEGFTPKTDPDLTDLIFDVSSKKRRTHRGRVWTTDALLKETKDIVNDKVEKGAIAVDMVTSSFVTISNLYGKRCVCILVVTDNLITGEMGFFDIRAFDGEKEIVDIAFEFLEELERA